MSLDREDRYTLGIGEIDGKWNPALQIALPLDDSDEDHPVLSGRKVGRVQFIEYTVNTEFPVRPGAGIRAKEEYRLHHSTPPPPTREHRCRQSNLWKSDTESSMLRLRISLMSWNAAQKPPSNVGHTDCQADVYNILCRLIARKTDGNTVQVWFAEFAMVRIKDA
jgi:hypothetical protein